MNKHASQPNSRGGRATKIANLENAITHWRYADGREYYYLEIRAEKGTGGDRHRERFYVEGTPGRYTAAERKLALERARSRRTEVVEARQAGHNLAAELNAKKKRTAKLTDFFYGPYRDWVNAGNIQVSTWGNYRRRMASYVLPLIGSIQLTKIDSALVTEMATILAMPQCEECEPRQAKENDLANHEQRPRRRYGHCRDGCGYGLSRIVVQESVLTLGSVLTRAKQLHYIDGHPLRDDDDFSYTRPVSMRRISERTPDMIEPVRRRLDPIEDLIISLLLYEGLRPQEALALQWRDLIDESGLPKGRINISKAITAVKPLKPGERPKLQNVVGVPAPLSVSRLKTAAESARPSQVQRAPELWRQIGELAVEVWTVCGRPPLDSFIVLSSTGPYAGYPPTVPGNWMQNHYRAKCLATGVHYDRHDSAYGLRHVAASMMAVGARMTTKEIADHLGNSEAVCARVYQHPFGSTGARDYRGLSSMEEVIDVAREKAGTQVPVWRTVTADAA